MSEAKHSPNTLKIKQVWDDYIAKRVLKQEIRNFSIDTYLADIICPGPFYYYIIDFSDRSLQYVSREISDVLGYDTAEYSVEKFFEILHPDDAAFMAACEEKICEFLYNEITPEQMLRYKFTYKFRLKDKNGIYKHILHQAIAISVDEDGQLYQVLGIHTDIGHITKLNDRQLSIIGLQGETSCLGVDPLKEGFQPQHEMDVFTSQEKRVLALMAEGLKTDTVADILNISGATIATHRKNILRKSGCKNTIEVVAKAIKEGII